MMTCFPVLGNHFITKRSAWSLSSVMNCKDTLFLVSLSRFTASICMPGNIEFTIYIKTSSILNITVRTNTCILPHLNEYE